MFPLLNISSKNVYHETDQNEQEVFNHLLLRPSTKSGLTLKEMFVGLGDRINGLFTGLYRTKALSSFKGRDSASTISDTASSSGIDKGTAWSSSSIIGGSSTS